MNVFIKAVGLANSSCSGAAAVCCNYTLGSPKTFLKSFDLECPFGSSTPNVSLASSPFVYSKLRNIFIAMGCHNLALLRFSDGFVGGCLSVCVKDTIQSNDSSCNGIDCCKTTIPSDLDVFNTVKHGKTRAFKSYKDCKYSSLVDQKWFEENLTNHFEVRKMSHVPMVLNWEIDANFSSHVMGSNSSNSTYQFANHSSSLGSMSSTFTGSCNPGFEGNLYLVDGKLLDIDECAVLESLIKENDHHTSFPFHPLPPRQSSTSTKTHYHHHTFFPLFYCSSISIGIGLLFLFIGGWWSYEVVKKRKSIKHKEKFFKQNGGLLLQQQLSSSEVTVEKTIKFFNSNNLEKATNNFNVNRISKVIDEGKLEEFVNEVVILSQINYRNVVKLLGCCLETKVPLLVYKFIPNGTLSQYLYDQNEKFPATWDMRLRIATEVVGALFYLHSAAFTPFYHLDIKTTSILLDDKYRAKVADFGTSRSIDFDQTHLTTIVQGTFGYLDPEYFQLSQFTEKSDVYSFGVFLVELLNGKKVISSTKEYRSLATYLIHSMETNNLFDIIDARFMNDAKQGEIITVANLAKMCLNLNRKK
ncbi:hypothetical protein ACJW31_07G141300 [Castanea mollissima]